MQGQRIVDPRYPDLELVSVWDGVPRHQVREVSDYGPSSLVLGACAQPAKGSRGVNTAATSGAAR